jgi:hypothetical protein
MVSLPTDVYIYSYFSSEMVLHMHCYFSVQLRGDYIRGQVYQGQSVQSESKHQWISSVQKEDSSAPRQKLDTIESYIAFA